MDTPTNTAANPTAADDAGAHVAPTGRAASRRRLARIAAGAVGVVAVGAVGVGIGSALDDPTTSVDAVRVPAARSAPTAPPPANAEPSGAPGTTAAPRAEAVAGLEQLVGVLRRGDDPDDWYLNGVDLDLGPDGWVLSAGPVGDFDGDGADEPLLTELDGLAGREVTLGVLFEFDDDRDRDDADVYTIAGITYREPTGTAPWMAPVEGALATRDDVLAAAAAAVGDGARAVELEPGDDGWAGWEVEVYDAGGREHQVYVDPQGQVVDVRRDD